MTSQPVAGQQQSSFHLARVAPALIVGLVAALAAGFVGSMLYFTDGHLSPPLDDTYIYFQYARQIAHGKVFIYFDGDPATSGSTSFLYPFVARRETLMAKPDAKNPNLYRFDIRTQGADETVFFDA